MEGYVLFDDTVLDKNASFAIELVRRQYSGNAKQVIKGIGVVTCVYVHPALDLFWLIDYRIYDPDGDGKSKLDHVREILTNVVYHKQLPFQAVLMDTWYATKDLMLFIESLQKSYYCPLKDNRQVDDARGKQPYQRVDALSWTADELAHGKRIKIKAFPKEHKVQLFRVVVSTHRTDYVVTNDWAQESTEATQEACGFRWKIEQLHREGKQAVSAVRHVSSAIILAVLFWCGSGSKHLQHKRVARCINSNTVCWMITSCSNSGTPHLGWFLRKSYLDNVTLG